MRRHATRGTHESFLIIPPSQDILRPMSAAHWLFTTVPSRSLRNFCLEIRSFAGELLQNTAVEVRRSIKQIRRSPLTPPRLGARRAKVKPFVMSYGR